MPRYVFDEETDDLLDRLTLMHCVCYYNYDTQSTGAITNYDEARAFFSQDDLTLIGHNIVRFDIPAAEKVLRIKINARLIDTLALSWYLFPLMEKHGLEIWGEYYRVPKPVVTDWRNLTQAEYIHRCTEDVKINLRLWNDQLIYLFTIYNGDIGEVNRIIDYLTFKLDCAREQEEVRWKLDVDKTNENLSILVNIKEEKINQLTESMPARTLYAKMDYPAKPYKKDGTLSTVGTRWHEKLVSLNLPEDHTDSIRFPKGEEPGNPNSHDQLKDWLFSLGWVPMTFKYVPVEEVVNGVKVKTKQNRAIPQISDDGKLCQSVRLLIEDNPQLEALNGLFIVSHRISILNGYLENVSEDGYLKAEVAGFTNTLRFKHKVLVNLPTIAKPYGDMMRGVLIADEGYVLCGSDMSSLEDSTKRHYMFFYDPEYVMEMTNPTYDPHIDIALQGNLMTVEEAIFYKWMDGKPIDVSEVSIRYTSMTEEEQHAEFKRLSPKRKQGKVVNFAAVYGAGPPKIVLSSGMPLELATILHKAYWKRNWSVKKIAEDCYVKTIGKQMWLYNPVSKFYYSLRYDKDRFSTLNQGTGVYCFDNYVFAVRRRGIRLCGQFHDEIAFPTPIDTEEQIREILPQCIQEVNDKLKLNVQLGISMDFGPNYAAIH